MKYSPQDTFNRILSSPLFFLSLAFLLWMFILNNFILGRLALINDAIPFYENIKFFTDQIQQGILPLWDPSFDWGIPNEFFLRRINEFNPFYFLIILLNKIGLGYRISFFSFLSFYYFLGILGFYSLAEKIFREKYLALIAALLLMFSCFISVLLQSFIIIIFVPMVWFFYFLLDFFKTPKQSSLLGLLLSSMFITTTYIPFYFLTIILTAIPLALLCYYQECKKAAFQIQTFIKKHLIFTIICLSFFLVSLIPGYNFLKESHKENFVLPQRHHLSSGSNPLEIYEQSIVVGGIPVTTLFKKLFSNLNKYKIGEFYISIPCFIFLLLGLITPLNKKLIFFYLWGFIIYLISLYDATPIYSFLYEHISYFKYFRNFQFFLWLLLLPLFILICTEHLHLFLEQNVKNKLKTKQTLTFIIILHAGLIIFLMTQENVILSSYVSCLLSLLSFFYLLAKKTTHSSLFYLLILTTIIIQPLEIFYSLNQHHPIAQYGHRYDNPYMNIYLPSEIKKEEMLQQASTADVETFLNKRTSYLSNIYLGTKWFYFLRQNCSQKILDGYKRSLFLLYDQVAVLNDDKTNLRRIQEAFIKNENIAFVSDKDIKQLSNNKQTFSNQAEIIVEGDPQLKVVLFTPNEIKLRTSSNVDKFLVYNDAYYPNWSVRIDGRKSDLWRTNIAFKGVWVPAGEHIVHFHFGNPIQYIFKFLLLIIMTGLLIMLVVTRFSEIRHETQKD